jgi:alkylation response protein AidB-like acyl-CoA dehydrogenase
VAVPDADRVGEVGSGWVATRTNLGNERLSGAARSERDGNFLMQQLLQLALRRDRDGVRPIDDAVVSERLASFYVKVKALQYTSYRVKAAYSAGRQPGPEVSLAKLAFGGLMQEMAAYALELAALGAPNGSTPDPSDEAKDWHAIFLRAAGLRVAGGTDEIQRNIIAERILGLPREPASHQ